MKLITPLISDVLRNGISPWDLMGFIFLHINKFSCKSVCCGPFFVSRYLCVCV